MECAYRRGRELAGEHGDGLSGSGCGVQWGLDSVNGPKAPGIRDDSDK